MRVPRTILRPRRAVQRDITSLVQSLRTSASNGLHLGCGHDLIQGLMNCDLFDPAADRAIGATDLSAFRDGTIDYIETNHMIEHLSFAEAGLAFQEFERVLAPGGHVAITCPDIGAVARRWSSNPNDRWSSTIKMLYGSQEHEGMFHKSGYDAPSLARELGAHGIDTLFHFTPYPRRPTPSLFLLGRRR